MAAPLSICWNQVTALAAGVSAISDDLHVIEFVSDHG